MRHASLTRGLFAAIFGLSAADGMAAPQTTVSARYADMDRAHRDFSRTDLSTTAFNREVGGWYRTFLGAAAGAPDAGALSDQDLATTYKAAELASFYTLDPGHARDLAAVTAELSRRGKLQASQVDVAYQTLLAARLFDQANSWRDRYRLAQSSAGMNVADPLGSQYTGPSLLAFGAAERALVRKPFPLKGKQIIAVTHPLCHFSANALNAVFADEQLRERLRGTMTLLVPQRRESAMQPFHEWNARHSATPFNIAYRIGDWPAIETWNTPIFYFMHDGVVVDKVDGWPKDGSRMAELRAALARIGPPVPQAAARAA